MINGFNTCIEMKNQRKNSKTGPDETPNQIEVSFAEPEPTRRIRPIIDAACAARGEAAQMTLNDRCGVELFTNGLRIRRRCSVSCTLILLLVSSLLISGCVHYPVNVPVRTIDPAPM